jgi:uncharacterized protein (TIGR04551 family)
MRRFLAILGASLVAMAAPLVQAQPRRAAEAEEEEPAEEEAAEEEEEWEEEEEEPQLRPPDVRNLQLGASEGEEEEAEGEETQSEEDLEEGEDDLPSPSDAQERLEGDADDADPSVSRWTTPQTVVDLHGYMRFRGEFQDNFFVDRVLGDSAIMGGPAAPGYENQVGRGMVLPFALFRPAEDDLVVPGGCGGSDPSVACQQHANAFANMRLRLEPAIHLSDDVRVRMQLDIFDNMVLGSTPNSYAVGAAERDRGGDLYYDPYYRYERTTFAPLDSATTTLEPPRYGVNSLTDSIIARRAWAEVRNRGLGELRFGRMGSHWGLGILANGGSGIDSDYQTDVDRIMLSTRLAGIYIFGAWDFASEGLLYQEPADLGGLAFDRSRLDDTDQFVVGAAYRQTEEEQVATLQRGDAVFNIGAYFVYRNQNLTSSGTTNPFGLCIVCNTDDGRLSDGGAVRDFGDPVFVRRGAEMFVPDLWMQFLYEKLRLELEAVFVYGTIDNLSNTTYDRPDDEPSATLLQFAFAFEGEYHLLNDQLGIYFNAGYASGDADVDGISRIGGLEQQVPAGPDGRVDRTYSTFYMHPNYRVDLIFWRNVMRGIGGAYYFRPGLSYDFIRNNFGQLLGARADVIWSRASVPVQTWGNADDLGVEIDVSLYYRSEDGPDILDGFYAQAQWGIFFPLDGLGYLPGTFPRAGSMCTNGRGCLGPAQTFRLLLGVQY